MSDEYKTIASTSLPTSIANFIYIICCKREGTANGESMIANFIRRNEKKMKEDAIKAAWALACAFTNRKGYVNEIRLLFPTVDKLSKQLFVLLVNYLGSVLLPFEGENHCRKQMGIAYRLVSKELWFLSLCKIGIQIDRIEKFISS